MLTLDQLLVTLVDNGVISSLSELSTDDKKVLISLRQQLKRMYFFTEKQGNLLIKIMQKYKEHFLNLGDVNIELINNPTWSENFRKIEEIRKIYFSDDKKTIISIEFPRDTDFKKKIVELFSQLDSKNIVSSTSNRIAFQANEYNIIKVIELLKNDNFTIENTLQELNDKILKEIEGKENFLDILDSRNKKLFDTVTKDSTQDNQDLLLLDRRIRFQYTFSPKNIENSLTYKIANRTRTDIWINENDINLDSVVKSLVELKRFPILVVFNANNPQQSKNLLEKLNSALETNNIDKKVGIYFRFDNNSDQEFNQRIKELNFNNYLDNTTNVVGLSTKHLPKFLLSNSWYPKTVITDIPNFRNSKVFSYCKSVDLVICHSGTAPLTGGHDVIM